ncbi:AAA family ATPase [Glutamicibacter soli]|uniref:AAA family ATPase n=1 Tax=Glutamicibacter soli TaxID=453836 RepID=A0A6L9FYR7_9MICC|nr:ATP-binding protein [Glutamicibacter soli]NAZ14721.1 AAA family ATPase [Glutamicibacter soli]
MNTLPGTDLSWLQRALQVLALRLRHEVALTRTLRGDGRQEGFLGLLLGADEAEAMLAEASGRLRASGTAVSAAALNELEEQLEAWVEQADDPFCRLVRALQLDHAETRLLLVACAPSLDSRYGAVYGYLNDDMTRRHLTPELAQRLLGDHGTGLAQLRVLLAETGRLAGHRALLPVEGTPWIQAALRPDPLLLDRVLGLEPALPGLRIGWGPPSDTAPGEAAEPGKAAVPAQIWQAVDQPDGRGARSALAAAGTGGILLLTPGDLPADPHQLSAALGSALGSALREARLRGLLPVLRGFDQAPPGTLQQLAAALRPPAMVLCDNPVAWQDARLAAAPAPAPLTRGQALAGLLAGRRADSPEYRGWLARLLRLDPLVLGGLLAADPDEAQLRQAIRDRLGRPLEHLADRLASDYTLDDLVLPARTAAALRELVHWHATVPTVRDDWGFGTVFGRGSGTTALFKGPSGTGKTMAAAALGHALQLPVFRVNLAGLVSKYIGETEKNLDRLFDAADGSDVVLFFDEADAIFGKRSEVHDAHDRYANLETAYLLQRIERHAGLSILASNLHQNIDDAFIRRLDAVIEFPAPSPAARRDIWQRLRRGRAPLADDVDLGQLAERFELTGGEIRNCALAAAHLAAAEGTGITMDTLMRAIARELAKAGKPIRRDDFGEHYAAARTGREG